MLSGFWYFAFGGKNTKMRMMAHQTGAAGGGACFLPLPTSFFAVAHRG